MAYKGGSALFLVSCLVFLAQFRILSYHLLKSRRRLVDIVRSVDWAILKKPDVLRRLRALLSPAEAETQKDDDKTTATPLPAKSKLCEPFGEDAESLALRARNSANAKLFSFVRSWFIAAGYLLQLWMGFRLYSMAFSLDEWTVAFDDLVFVLAFIAVTLLNHRPDQVEVMPEICYCASMAISLALLLVSEKSLRSSNCFSFVDVLLIRGVVSLPRTISGFLTSNIALLVLCNVAFFCAFAVSVVLHTDVSCCEISAATKIVALFTDVCSSVAMSLIVVQARSLLLSDTIREIMAVETSCHLSVTTRLLRTGCDALVELDDGLRLTGPSFNLANLNGLTDSSTKTLTSLRSYEGLGFEALCSTTSEVDRFMAYMEGHERVPAVELGGFMTLKLCTRGNADTDVSISHVSFTKYDGKLYHLLAITVVDTERAATDQGISRANRAVEIDELLDSREDHSSMLDVSMMSTVKAEPCNSIDEAVVVFDAYTMELVGASASFVSRMGPCPRGAFFTDWLADGRNKHYRPSYTDFVNEFENALQESSAHSEEYQSFGDGNNCVGRDFGVLYLHAPRTRRGNGPASAWRHQAPACWEATCRVILSANVYIAANGEEHENAARAVLKTVRSASVRGTSSEPADANTGMHVTQARSEDIFAPSSRGSMFSQQSDVSLWDSETLKAQPACQPRAARSQL
eukprot:TRINITY_DN19527_c0_g1_i1.p1 TRINITY_DN19527_c0_g1~~TRINITY_DN19527_c0_g1_i1.p1  ORF type:complete len:689 (-),score=71.85 TRINITY_DN19527_c0_g1_i1:126-2192(-)